MIKETRVKKSRMDLTRQNIWYENECENRFLECDDHVGDWQTETNRRGISYIQNTNDRIK
jgi:hypothetical protein